MTVYGTLSRVFVHSFTAKVFAVAFVGTHVPLLVFAVYALGQEGGWAARSDVLWVLLGATLAGTVGTLLLIQAILRPLYQVEAAMRSFEELGEVQPLPDGFKDEIGRVMQRTNRMMAGLRRRLDASQLSADTDPLTGLLNRRGFDRRVANPGPGVVVHFDLDHFKMVNDTLGHDAGDTVLQAVARTAVAALRRGDVLARFGGEEFVAFLPGADVADAEVVAERLRAAIEAGVQIAGRPVTASVGVGWGKAGLTDLIAAADQATYRSKHAGRNRVSLVEVGGARAADA